jgi:hypothetical protein
MINIKYLVIIYGDIFKGMSSIFYIPAPNECVFYGKDFIKLEVISIGPNLMKPF